MQQGAFVRIRAVGRQAGLIGGGQLVLIQAMLALKVLAYQPAKGEDQRQPGHLQRAGSRMARRDGVAHRTDGAQVAGQALEHAQAEHQVDDAQEDIDGHGEG